LDTGLMTLSSKSLHLSHSRKSPQPSQPVRSRHNADSGPRTVGAIHRGKPPASVDVVVTKFSATPSKAFHRGLFHSRRHVQKDTLYRILDFATPTHHTQKANVLQPLPDQSPQPT
jgi:hypothetical protein